MGRSAGNVDCLVPSYRVALSDFLACAPLEESSIILDGPGIGCTSHSVLLALLGIERLTKLRAIHFFSSSGYAGFFLDASQKQQLKITRQSVAGWNQRNQRHHRIKLIVTAFRFLGTKLIGKRWYFGNHLLADFLRSGVTDEYANAPIESLPANFHFWTFDTTGQEFCDIHAASLYSHWTPTDVISSLVAVPGIYQPFEKEGHIYLDAIRGLGVRALFRDLRKQSHNVLFWHMNWEGRRDNTLFVKGHQGKSGIRRVVGDFTRFLLGLDNPEFDRSIELGLFDLADKQEPLAT
jgi:hypothetical protein